MVMASPLAKNKTIIERHIEEVNRRIDLIQSDREAYYKESIERARAGAMSVGDLINELKKLDPSLPIVFYGECGLEYALQAEESLDQYDLPCARLA